MNALELSFWFGATAKKSYAPWCEEKLFKVLEPSIMSLSLRVQRFLAVNSNKVVAHELNSSLYNPFFSSWLQFPAPKMREQKDLRNSWGITASCCSSIAFHKAAVLRWWLIKEKYLQTEPCKDPSNLSFFPDTFCNVELPWENVPELISIGLLWKVKKQVS